MDYNFKRKWSQHAEISQQFNIFFAAFSFADSQDSMGRKRTVLIPPYHFYPLTKCHKFVYSFASEITTLLITAHIIARLIETDQPLEISNFNLLVDIISYVITVISHRQIVNLNSYQLLSYNYIRRNYPSKLTKLLSKSRGDSR